MNFKTFKNIGIPVVLLMVIGIAGAYRKSKPFKALIPVQDTVRMKVSLVVLGTIQDAGSPHIACRKDCCKELFAHPDPDRKVVSLGLIDYRNRKTYLFEASPDMGTQLKMLKSVSGFEEKETPDAIFISHAHIGHYTGLMYLGREAMDAKKIPVYALPRMLTFLQDNGPWDQLVRLQNIVLNPMQSEEEVGLGASLSVKAIQVPHRDEYSETAGFLISGPNKKLLFIPDIDKWEKWEQDIVNWIKAVDYVLIDGTFYDADEIKPRDISQIPHPFVSESMRLFGELPDSVKKRVHFIHLNHSNPLLNERSEPYKKVLENGYRIAAMGQLLDL